ncbi:MAG: Nramp family divalent metal transporter, partial [bacterium]|nr:Nramp family divalent metal transporter [bacterium]
MLKALGPGIIWLGLAQGSGELIWWPYLVAKYGLLLISLMIPAAIMQYPLTYNIGYYTIKTGNTIWSGYVKKFPRFSIFLWILMIISFLWFGAFASAGSTAFAHLIDFPRSIDIKYKT